MPRRLAGGAPRPGRAGAPRQAPRPEGQGARPRGRERPSRWSTPTSSSNLQESLGLTDEQFAKLLPLVQRLQADRGAVRGSAGMQPLHGDAAAARVGGGHGGAGRRAAAELKAAEAEEPAASCAGPDAVDAVLTPVQQVKFRILEAEVEQRIRELMARVRAQRRGQGAARAPAAGVPQPASRRPRPACSA